MEESKKNFITNLYRGMSDTQLRQLLPLKRAKRTDRFTKTAHEEIIETVLKERKK